jgi:hypothetical protein
VRSSGGVPTSPIMIGSPSRTPGDVLRFALPVLCVIACKSGLDYGAKPHLLGKLDGIDVHLTRQQLVQAMPELAQDKDVVDGHLRYRAWFDHADRITSLMVFVDGTIDDVLHAWGPGTDGLTGSRLARYYFDDAHKTRFDVALPPELTSKRFIVSAAPFRHLSTVIDDGADVKLFGIDVLDVPTDRIIDALAKQGVPVGKPDVPKEMAEFVQSTWHSRGPEVTESGVCEIEVSDRGNTGRITAYSLDCSTLETPDAEKQLLAVFEKKWGKPTESGTTRSYASADLHITADARAEHIELKVSR